MHIRSTGSPVRCGGVGRGEDVESELWKVPAELAERYVMLYPERYSTLTEEQASGIIELCRWARGEDPDMEKVTDPERIHAIDVKLRAKAAGYPIELSEYDLKALDPADSSVPGIDRPMKGAHAHFRGREPVSDEEAVRIEMIRKVEIAKKA